ncbi:glutamate--cysteine ligase [Halanaerobium saccharolyticum]|uniref:Glutamate--cysteine ligase n=1 Tax=Halanaerobium saccharolyticum TaxID=43595 RepID=A0A4R7Z275_9FIRM|nr:glutamate-cysteine ligase family protein [Halanaerobium saccharolyticum]RAK07490.1 glutamate--cysteine ligase [Halanaerobium saccharolyticum]TDW03067.1 glutamate--cysteine ligase [Halanaerobium saccharolyticum]TDX59363.1 glutamate--cysteine ligase [Halanaerobium saccharolyticum]
MDYQKQIDTFVRYFKSAESKKEDHKIGMEFEHLILNEDLTAVDYFGEQGIESLLHSLGQGEWEKVYEKEHLIGLKANEKIVTLEPGGQLEISIAPFPGLEKTEKIYLEFIEELKEILNKRGQKLAVLGYQPRSSIKDIPMLPKKRYDFMYKYFKNTGKYAHHMMKGTASVQMNIDYINEKDYTKKMRVGYFLSPLIYYLFDNTPFFEGQPAANSSIREEIWTNCDSQRSGIIEGIFDKEFGYSDYAEYLLNTPPIIRKKEEELLYTDDQLLKNVMENDKLEEVEHFISMVFPDVRTKKYIEIRSADALPYPYNFAFAALLKSLFYNQENLDYLYQLSLSYNQQQFLKFREEILRTEKNSKREKLIIEIFKRAEAALDQPDLNYLKELKKLYLDYGRFKFKTLSNLKQGKKEALDWCLLN